MWSGIFSKNSDWAGRVVKDKFNCVPALLDIGK